MKGTTLAVEIGPETWQLAHGSFFVEFPLERQENGQLTAGARQRIVEALRQQGQAHGGIFQARALCAIGARGISLRRMTLPSAPKEKMRDLLRLQVENEFPVPPEQLAWGWQTLSAAAGPMAKQNDVLVAALRRSTLEEWTEIFAAAGVGVSFTPAALARLAIIAPPEPECALLDLGRRNSELIIVSKGAASGLRALPWGAENLAEASLPTPPTQKIYLTGPAANQPEVARRLSAFTGGGCQPLLPFAGGDRSATMMALQRLATGEAANAPLLLQSGESQSAGGRRWPRQWAALAAALALGVLLFPYVESLLFKPHLTKRLGQIHAEEKRLDVLDRELGFFQYLRKSQPPALDLFGLIAQCAPAGTTFESYTLTRRGDLSLRGKMGDGTQVTDFRSKLMDSGWFTSVVVDEQSLQQDRKVSVRVTAQLKSADMRRPLPSAAETKTEKPTKT